MVKKDVPKWNTIRVRESTYREIEKALNYDEVKKEGISSITQFVTNAITKHLKELESERMKHINMYDDHVKIMDNNLGNIGRIVSVYFKKGKTSWCDYCEETDCIHVQYAWEIPDVRSILETQGLKPPPSRV